MVFCLGVKEKGRWFMHKERTGRRIWTDKLVQPTCTLITTMAKPQDPAHTHMNTQTHTLTVHYLGQPAVSKRYRAADSSPKLIPQSSGSPNAA